MSKVVAIHQPNFFPWLGYFDKLAKADVFIFLDDVQFSKTGGTWTNRVKLLLSGEAQWVTAAIDRNYSGVRTINEMEFLSLPDWRRKTLATLKMSYARHPYFVEVMEVIEPLIRNPETKAALYNGEAIRTLARHLRLDETKIQSSSQLEKLGSSNELLVSLTQSVGGAVYLCGGGADGYQEEALFAQNSVQLVHQKFVHPTYPQKHSRDFVPGLSVIDAAMNLGWSGAGELLARKTEGDEQQRNED